MEAEKFYRFYYLNLLTGETGCSVSKIPEADRDIWFEHLSRTEPTFAYWSKEIKAEGDDKNARDLGTGVKLAG